MTQLRTAIAAALTLLSSSAAFAQADSTCIVAGRLNDAGQWAPRMAGVQLLAQDGKAVTSADKQALAGVKQVRLSSASLLSRCDGSGQLAQGPESPDAKGPAPAVPAGTWAVQAVNFPKLRRAGELVELQVSVPAERVTMVTR